MKKLIPIFLVVLLMTFCMPLVAAEEAPTLEARAEVFAQTVEENSINLPGYVRSTINWWGEVFLRFAKTAKPNVVFNDEAVPGLQITLYEETNWAFVGGIVWRYEDVPMEDQPLFYGVEWQGFPLLSGLSDIFKKLNPELVYTEGDLKFGLTYLFID